MRWDIFSGRKTEQKRSIRDEINDQVKCIERFAPRKYKSERAVHYYNYHLMDAYLNPLSSLLNLISQEKRIQEDEEAFVSELFMKLKDFYDVKQRLSLPEAIQDRNLQRRFVQLFLIFYGTKDTTKLKACLERLDRQG